MFHFGQSATMCRFGIHRGLISTALKTARPRRPPLPTQSRGPADSALEILRTGSQWQVFRDDPNSRPDYVAGDH